MPPAPFMVLEPAPAADARLLANDSLFREGFYSPSVTTYGPDSQGLPWKSVREVMQMADNALKAKQRAAEKLAKQLEALNQQGPNATLLKRAQRAEVDSGVLLDELQQLMQAKADAAQQHADLNRTNALLIAERELLCEQLEVSPDSVNLCQAVSHVLATAKKAKALDVQVRMLAKCQRELLLQLEAQQEAAARAEQAARQWQAEKQVYMQLLAQHGIQPPQVPSMQDLPTPSPIPVGGQPAAAAAAQDAAAGLAGSSNLNSSGSLTSSSSAALMAKLVRLRMQGSASSGQAGSPHTHLPPGTPPAHDLAPVAHIIPAASLSMRRGHSLDSGLNSLTGLLDQLALGQLCSSDDSAGQLFGEPGDTESWTMADTLSGDMDLWFAGSAAATVAGAGSSSSSTGGSGCSTSSRAAAAAPAGPVGMELHLSMPHQQLQPVLEAAEECFA